MAVGGNIKAKLYLEGIEVPFIGASITSSVNRASIAYVDIVPLDEIRHIKPRTHVSIHVKDDANPDAGKRGRFVLAWEGEVFGYNFGRTVSSRTMTLNCIDFSGYWDSVLTYYFDPRKSMNKQGLLGSEGLNIEAARKSQVSTHTVSFSNASSYLNIFQEALKKPGADELDAFVAIFDKLSAANAFYDYADKRYRITERYVLGSSGAIQNLLSGQNAIEWFKSVGGVVSGFHSLRELIMMFLGIIYHDTIPIPFPARVKTSRLLIKDSKQRLAVPENVEKTIGQFVFKPNLYMTAPPICNVFYPDEYSSFQFSRNFLQEPTRMAYQPTFMKFQSTGQVVLDWVYQPDSLSHYMKGKKDGKKYEGNKDLDVNFIKGTDGEPAFTEFFNKDMKNKYAEFSAGGRSKEYHFMTNEELYKGIILAKEAGFPAASSFTSELSGAFKQQILEQVTRYSFFKKRFQTRTLQITSHLKTSVVPGFPVLILDDSEANHNVVAYCDSVSHRIYATEGGFTNVNLSYARTVDEQDISSNEGQDAFLPNWFLSSVFGENAEVKGEGRKIVFDQAGLLNYYRSVLGDKGSTPITSLKKDVNTIQSATNHLINEYNIAKSRGEGSVQKTILTQARRDYIETKEAFKFLGAYTKTENPSEDYQVYSGPIFELSGSSVAPAVENKKKVIEKYQKRLKSTRGIRG